MSTTLLNPWNWARAEFSGARLGDRRRSRRLVQVAAALAREPRGALHGALPTWSELLAAYRLLNREAVTFESVTEPHRSRTREACGAPGEYLLVEDTTSLDFTAHEATAGLGRIGDDGGRGLYLHSTLALRVEGWEADGTPTVTALGLFAQQCWARTTPTVGRGKEAKRRRLTRARESERWAAVFEESGAPPPGARWTYVADRESDIYEVFARCAACRVEWIVRANQPRALAEADGSVFSAVAQTAPLGIFALELRARPGRKKRTARLEVRAARVMLRGPWRPGEKLAPRELNVVEAREVGAPPGVEAVHWVLLTSWPAGDFAAARRVARTYTRRWLIEEYHKALKTGAGVEESQLMSVHNLRALIGVLAVVAVRLLNLKLLATAHPEAPLEADELGPEALTLLARAVGPPQGGWTHATALVAVARLGGFLARKGDGAPGWISIWRGWHRLMLMLEGFRLALDDEKCV